jgi:hypothetical protein
MKNLLIADAATGGADTAKAEKPAETIARLTAENARLNALIAGFEADTAQRAADELLIAQKTALGLTRDQAIAVIKRQREHDEAVKRESGEALKRETDKTAAAKSRTPSPKAQA